LALIGMTAGCAPRVPASAPPRPLTLWAWERPERLGFLDPAQIAVAFLAGTLYLRGAEVQRQPRLQLLQLPPGIPLTAVVRIQSEGTPTLGPRQVAAAVAAIRGLADRPGLAGLQLDFDAARSQRPFYRELLQALRQALPTGQGLSITALASWCLQDRWLTGLPLDYAVPMLFRMGAGAAEARRVLAREGEFPEPLCRAALGVADDEPWPVLGRPRPLFAFRVRPWDQAAVTRLQEEYRRWSGVAP
jgi:hypothetical protein